MKNWKAKRNQLSRGEKKYALGARRNNRRKKGKRPIEVRREKKGKKGRKRNVRVYELV